MKRTTAPTEHADVLVVGAGLAGLRTATLLAQHGHHVVLIERHRRLTEFIRTMVLYLPSLRKPLRLSSGRDEFRVGEMGPLYEHYARSAVMAGVDLRLGVRFLGPTTDGWLVKDDDGARRISPGSSSVPTGPVPRWPSIWSCI